jgi:nifR3 family TIM-barrel protein
MARMSLRIGRLHVDPPVVLAPMAGITDAAFRVVCAESADAAARSARPDADRPLFVSEMVTARGLVEGNAKSWAMTRHHPAESVRSLQLYGSDPMTMGTAVARLVDAGAVDHLDLNFGCPVPKVTRNGGGAALPVKRRLLAAVVRAAVRAAEGVPVTVKMRMGLDEDRLTYLEAGRIAADEGAAAVALHARTARQGYAGEARWEAIARLKAHLPDVPVLGNGDIWAAEDARAMVDATGCDGVVIGRGCLGRPWLFADLVRVFAGQPAAGPPHLGELLPTIHRHLGLAVDAGRSADRGHDAAGGGRGSEEAEVLRRFRKHLRWYLQGYAVGPDLHARAGLAASVADVLGVLDDADPCARVVPAAVRAPRGRQGPMARLILPEGWCDDPDAPVAVAEPAGLVDGG